MLSIESCVSEDLPNIAITSLPVNACAETPGLDEPRP